MEKRCRDDRVFWRFWLGNYKSLVNTFILKTNFYFLDLFINIQANFAENLGQIYKIRLGFEDNIPDYQNWLLDTVSTFEKIKINREISSNLLQTTNF